METDIQGALAFLAGWAVGMGISTYLLIRWMDRGTVIPRLDDLRLRITRRICPSSHRLVEVGDVMIDEKTVRADLVRGGDALEQGWGCDPAILWNAAAYLQRPHYGRRASGGRPLTERDDEACDADPRNLGCPDSDH
jgi:hypothetical protein